MAHINAHSLTLAGKDWLADSRHPRILHVFDHACNLINERREILSVVTSQIGNGPFNLVVEHDVLFSDHLHVKSPISIHVNQLNLGYLNINTINTRLWSPCSDWEGLYARRDDMLNQLASLPIPAYEPSVPAFLLSALTTSIVNADIPPSLTAAQELAGLGIGLTPAGDDFILGAILAAWIIHPVDVAGVLAEEVAKVAAALTTSLSAAWLRSAGRGEAGILWHQSFSALRAGDSFAIQRKITKLLSMGHTSGADALAGFVGVFISWEDSFRRDSQPKVIG